MVTRRQLADNQLLLMDKIRALSNINMVTCGHCGTLLLHEIDDKETITCFGCKKEMSLSDCPDYWYSGCTEGCEFDDY